MLWFISTMRGATVYKQHTRRCGYITLWLRKTFPHCNPHHPPNWGTHKRTLTMVLSLVGSQSLEPRISQVHVLFLWGEASLQPQGLSNRTNEWLRKIPCRCHLLCDADCLLMTQHFIKTVSLSALISALSVSGGGRGFKCSHALCIISCRLHIVTIVLPGLLTTRWVFWVWLIT